jgi:hypothetical protein
VVLELLQREDRYGEANSELFFCTFHWERDRQLFKSDRVTFRSLALACLQQRGVNRSKTAIYSSIPGNV